MPQVLDLKDNFVGRHLLLDVQLKSNKGLAEIAYIYDVMEGLSKELDMTLVYPPIVGRFPWAVNELERYVLELEKEGVTGTTVLKMKDLIYSRRTEDAGISGICIWLESHAAIHTWTEESFFSFDAYSCKEFNTKKALEFLLPRFDVEAYNGLNILRTINEPQKIDIIKG
jgi:S-adenosylmethionine decarboxylase